MEKGLQISLLKNPFIGVKIDSVTPFLSICHNVWKKALVERTGEKFCRDKPCLFHKKSGFFWKPLTTEN